MRLTSENTPIDNASTDNHDTAEQSSSRPAFSQKTACALTALLLLADTGYFSAATAIIKLSSANQFLGYAMLGVGACASPEVAYCHYKLCNTFFAPENETAPPSQNANGQATPSTPLMT